jgi:hypothetical protein
MLDYALFNSVSKELGADYARPQMLSPARAEFWASWLLEADVNNGGFHQFFMNQGPAAAAAALEFHTKHGPAKVAKLIGLAIKALRGGRLPADFDAIHDVLVPDDPKEDDRLTIALSKVDSKYYKLLVSLTHMRLRFALDNQAEFFA